MKPLREWIPAIILGSPPWMAWLMLGVMGLLIALVGVFVDLKPYVDEDFFFSAKDPQYQQSKKIDEIFHHRSQLIISVSAPDTSSESYLHKIRRLTETIKTLDKVNGVRSLSSGPKDYQDAVKSPLWRRLLIAENRKSTNLIVLVEGKEASKLIEKIEEMVKNFNSRNFQIRIAGAPYVVAMIQRCLVRDFICFSSAAILIFGGAMLPIFRSWRIVAGMLTTCISAVMLSLLGQHLLGMKIGILTANLSTIVFVLTFSHLVYMTTNWRNLASKRNGDRMGKLARHEQSRMAVGAYRLTLPPSFWCMICTSLGFATLLLVQAKPLRELGLGGSIGTLSAFLCAYSIYPFFLRSADPPRQKNDQEKSPSPFGSKPHVWPVAALFLLTITLSFGLPSLNTDPSLLDYFKKRQPLRDGLEFVDHNGGSSPLEIVIADKNGEKLNTETAYKKMWKLQEALESHPSVGSVISLPVLLAEGDRSPLSFLLSWEFMLKIMEKPAFDKVADNFITRDRTKAMFLIRMVETQRHEYRVKVVDKLRSIVRDEGFAPVMVGGIYQLQGQLARLVAKSMVEGLEWLFAVFFIIGLFISKSFRIAISMIISLSLCRFCMLGAAGFLKIPVDIISAPAANVCIGMAVDAMVHVVFAYRRNLQNGEDPWKAWVAGRNEQWRAVTGSAVIIATGFAIFTLSSFPPTQRFGLIVVFGTMIDILATLLVLPLLGGVQWKKLFGKDLSATDLNQ